MKMKFTFVRNDPPFEKHYIVPFVELEGETEEEIYDKLVVPEGHRVFMRWEVKEMPDGQL